MLKIKKLTIFFFLVICFCLGEGVFCQEVKPQFGGKAKSLEDFHVEVTYSTEKLTIHDLLQVTITLNYPNGFSLDIKHLKKNLLQSSRDFLLKDEEMYSEETLDDSKKALKIEYFLEPLKKGSFLVSFYEVFFFKKEDPKERVEIFSPIRSIEVTLPEEELSNTPITDLLNLSEAIPIEISKVNQKNLLLDDNKWEKEAKKNEEFFRNRKFSWKLLFLLLVFGVALFFVGKWLKRFLFSKYKEQELLVDPEEKALQALEKVLKKKLPEKKKIDEFYVEITSILRLFIEEKYCLNAPEQTTEEFLQNATKHAKFSKNKQEQLSDFLIQADLVKFAKMYPEILECEQAFSKSKDFILDKGC